MGRNSGEPGSQRPCRRCGAIETCADCLSALRTDRQRDWGIWVACDRAVAAAGLALEERQRLYGGQAPRPEPLRRRPRDRSGYGAGVRPRRALSRADAAEYGVSNGVLVNLRTGEVARSDG